MIEELIRFLYPSRCYLCVKGEPKTGFALCRSCIEKAPIASQKCIRCARDPCLCDYLKFRGRITVGYDLDLDPRICRNERAMVDLFLEWELARTLKRVIPFTKRDVNICKQIGQRLPKGGYMSCTFTKGLNLMGQRTMHIRAHTPLFYTLQDKR